MEVDLDAVEVVSGRVVRCSVAAVETAGVCALAVSAVDLGVIEAKGEDFEEAFDVLRAQLEARGLLLLCNRYRRDALVTSLSRQMSRGLRCYVVAPRKKLDPDGLVDCLGAAEVSAVATASEARDFIRSWQAWFERPWFLRWFR